MNCHSTEGKRSEFRHCACCILFGISLFYVFFVVDMDLLKCQIESFFSWMCGCKCTKVRIWDLVEIRKKVFRETAPDLSKSAYD